MSDQSLDKLNGLINLYIGGKACNTRSEAIDTLAALAQALNARSISPRLMRIVGVTTDGRWVVGGAFKMADTKGVDLSLQLTEAERLGVSLSWPSYITDARKAGWPDKTIFKHIRAAYCDLGRWDEWDVVVAKLRASGLETT